MKAITYRNTKSTIPRWTTTIHEGNPVGYAYETDTHFVHFYGKDQGWYVISHGLTVTQKKDGTLEDWVYKTFGAEDVRQTDLSPGEIIRCCWRPGLYFQSDTLEAFNLSTSDVRVSTQALRLLIDRLDELFIYIEPESNSFATYSHKTRELLILACTEVENFWTMYMNYFNVIPENKKNYTTKDYVKLASVLHLDEYEFSLKNYAGVPSILSFKDWHVESPTTSLKWYNAYNKTKHDRHSYFSLATLKNCIDAVVANLVLFSTMFSPYALFDQSDTFSSLIKQHFEFRLINSDSKNFYIPLIDPSTIVPNLVCHDSHKYYKGFNTIKITL